MSLSYHLKMNWQDFWDNQQNNPNNELAFQYKNQIYILIHENYKWMIAEYDDHTFEVGKILAIAEESAFGHKNYHDVHHWDDLLEKCLQVLEMPVFDGYSFKEIIPDICFED